MAHTSPVVRATTDQLMMLKHRKPHRARATSSSAPSLRAMAPARQLGDGVDSTLTDADRRLLADAPAPAAECA